MAGISGNMRTYTHIHTRSWREVRWISKVARGCSLSHNNNNKKKGKEKNPDWSLTRLSHCKQNTHSPSPCDEQIQANFVQRQRGNCKIEKVIGPGASYTSTAQRF